VSGVRIPELEELCRRLVSLSRGSLTSVIICTEEAEILAHNPVMEVDQDAAAIASQEDRRRFRRREADHKAARVADLGGEDVS
jgi:hypothetical protein